MRGICIGLLVSGTIWFVLGLALYGAWHLF
jgi:hypothetical protein